MEHGSGKDAASLHHSITLPSLHESMSSAPFIEFTVTEWYTAPAFHHLSEEG